MDTDSVSVRNGFGKMVSNYSVIVQANEIKRISLSAVDFPSGFYILTIKGEKTANRIRLIKE